MPETDSASSPEWFLSVRAVPNARKNEVVGFENSELKIKVQAVPEDGKANKELVKFLSKHVGVSKSQINIHSGETSRHKRLSVSGISKESFIDKLKL